MANASGGGPVNPNHPGGPQNPADDRSLEASETSDPETEQGHEGTDPEKER